MNIEYYVETDKLASIIVAYSALNFITGSTRHEKNMKMKEMD